MRNYLTFLFIIFGLARTVMSSSPDMFDTFSDDTSFDQENFSLSDTDVADNDADDMPTSTMKASTANEESTSPVGESTTPATDTDASASNSTDASSSSDLNTSSSEAAGEENATISEPNFLGKVTEKEASSITDSTDSSVTESANTTDAEPDMPSTGQSAGNATEIEEEGDGGNSTETPEEGATTSGSTDLESSENETETSSSTDPSNSNSTPVDSGDGNATTSAQIEATTPETSTNVDNTNMVNGTSGGITRPSLPIAEIPLTTGTVLPVVPGTTAVLILPNGTVLASNQAWPLTLPNGTLIARPTPATTAPSSGATLVSSLTLMDGSALIPISPDTSSITILPKGSVLQTPTWMVNQQTAVPTPQVPSVPQGSGSSPSVTSGWGSSGSVMQQPSTAISAPLIGGYSTGPIGYGPNGYGQLGSGLFGFGSFPGLMYPSMPSMGILGGGYQPQHSAVSSGGGWGSTPVASAPVSSGWGSAVATTMLPLMLAATPANPVQSGWGSSASSAVVIPAAGAVGYGGLGGTGAQLGGPLWQPFQNGMALGMGMLGLRSANLTDILAGKSAGSATPSSAKYLADKDRKTGEVVSPAKAISSIKSLNAVADLPTYSGPSAQGVGDQDLTPILPARISSGFGRPIYTLQGDDDMWR